MFVHRLSKFFVLESATSSSSNDAVGFTEKDNLEYLDKFIVSGSSVDKRFLKLFRVMNMRRAPDVKFHETAFSHEKNSLQNVKLKTNNPKSNLTKRFS